MNRLSVVVPAYNRAHLIGETLRSLLKQTRPAQEIIVVDDGSTDDTAAIARQEIEKWKAECGNLKPEVQIIRQPNAGPARARNTGFRASRGEFIHFFDSDDLAAPNKQEIQLAALEFAGADISYGPWLKGRFDGTKFVASNQVLQQMGLPKEANLVKALLTTWSVVPHAALFRRSIVEKAGGFSEDLYGTEDQQMFLACLLAGAKVVHTPDTIEFYREGDPGKITESKTGHLRLIREWSRFLQMAREMCLQKGIEPLRWFGYRSRLWAAEQELRHATHENQEMVSTLRTLLDGGTPDFLYGWSRRLERWRGGLQKRLTGGRAHKSFRIGKITPIQIASLSQLGYEYRPNTP